jgi:hypothetical protein
MTTALDRTLLLAAQLDQGRVDPAPEHALGVGVDSDGDWFLFSPGKSGRGEGWTPERERIIDLTAEQVRAILVRRRRPDWIADSDAARASAERGPCSL